MTFKPDVIVFDYETALLTGEASTEAYRRDFRVTSCAFSWITGAGDIKSMFVVGEAETGKMLRQIAKSGIPLVAHNIQFEILVTMCRFPDIVRDLRWAADTMRLVQVYDNGGKFDNSAEGALSIDDELEKAMAEANGEEFTPESKGPPLGLGLDAAVKRILPRKYHGHKKEAYDWIRANTKCGKKNKPGRYLNQLPMDIMKRYNIGDTENTLRLYLHITDEFRRIEYDYTVDHSLYMGSVWAIVNSKIRGVRVNMEKLEKVKADIFEELYQIDVQFKKRFAKEIETIESQRVEKWCNEPKTEKGRANRRAKIEADRGRANPRVRDTKKNKWDIYGRFNIGSNMQLRMLFVDLLKMEPRFLTDKGSPSFKSPALPQWGDGGLILSKRRKRLLVYKQACNLHTLAEYDGRFHLDLKACGTATGRFAGGSYGG